MRVLVADDHPINLEGIKNYITNLGHEVVLSCTNGKAALNGIIFYKPDLALIDINMPEISGIEVARKVQEEKLLSKIVLLTMHNEKSVYKKALEYGVSGYILKNAELTEIEKCLNSIEQNIPYENMEIEQYLVGNKYESELDKLSLMERKIIEMLSEGLSNKQIGENLFISDRTVEWHRSNIVEKLELPKEKNVLLKWAMQMKNDGFTF